ncbi:iron export ABC transporter permease subunit FetB [Halobacillus litoralis]|uniref:Iron export ABC transporter permease subunit FetB n=1 Tax=Halobacillus litoralis TaxID=45668 RepID=A0A845DRG9_9BACI|nr:MULTISPECIES: iron export ABC transporter permease subunit FetB [Halobacillus]MCA1021377.1 iron export ABC transporter permease subunit FetB [Halobacillus litoralis]MYL19768.1 iron export ABC transporter permease subunit FetB [Halobacillus litoralis]MYL28914.1 iron export ABC transporter permease subunit FetB [Halobacillus halophilus]MYL37165.1 iron export ABC transporter permease subunit FetB [Halobacillus litoralis]
MAPEISNQSLLFLVIFVIVPLALSYFYQLGVSKNVLWSTFRGTVQLFAIGYILTFLFELPASYGIPFMLSVMIIIATFHARQRGKELPYVGYVLFAGLVAIEAGVLGLWLVFDMIQFKPSEVIPMSGMVIGNSMTAMGLALERMKSEFKENNGRLLAALSLGAEPKQASHLIVQKTLHASLIPNVDRLKTIGLVQLPGMMTGLILGGVSPVMAIKYQLVISLSIFSSVSLSSMFITLAMYRYFFNREKQLLQSEEEIRSSRSQ